MILIDILNIQMIFGPDCLAHRAISNMAMGAPYSNFKFLNLPREPPFPTWL
jgi:hypothetical protein